MVKEYHRRICLDFLNLEASFKLFFSFYVNIFIVNHLMFENDTIFPLLIGNAANYLFSS